MAKSKRRRIFALSLVLVAIGIGAYWLSRPEPTPPVVGVVRSTEVRIAPEVGGQLATIKVHKGDRVHAGEVVAELSAIELTAAVGQARAEQVASLAAEIAKAKSRLEYAEQQLTRTTYLTGRDAATQQALDQATNDAASARADVAEAQVKAAASALAVLERQLDKTVLRAPADGVVSVIVGEVGENIHAGQPVL